MLPPTLQMTARWTIFTVRIRGFRLKYGKGAKKILLITYLTMSADPNSLTAQALKLLAASAASLIAIAISNDIIPGKTDHFVEPTQIAGKTLAKLALPLYTQSSMITTVNAVH
ncbi:hypothetical protein M378DRAFT_391748 [Amanita muscaria Koide BX008]|uniref:Uncharacterized protein n=1 Tax=Amanita muscaria (strain Koide BX008) TaxID=946122 RepID=A0A0C2THV7_AMAMK|nr:hypothetical protein M378DRAFT_391748 [Amanita muscaria Koide BX008]